MNTAIRTFCWFTFVSLLFPTATAFGQFNNAPVLLPFPQADYSYTATSYPVADPANEDSTAGTWRYPASTQPKPAGSIYSVAGLEMSAAPGDVQSIESMDNHFDGESLSMGQLTCGCDTCANPIPGGSPCSGWFGSVAALFMARNEGGHYQFSFDNDPLGSRDHIHMLDIREADMGLSGGFDVRIGHYFHGGQLGIELIYWGLYPGSQQSILTPSGFIGTLDPILNFDRVSIGGTGVDSWTNDADAHRIRRSFDIHNAEINLVNFSGCTIYDACGRPKFGFSWGAGFRFFQLSEELLFSARETGMGAIFDDGQNQIDYSVDVDNNLFGGQIGGEGRWFATENLSIVLSTKVGLFGNSIQHRSRIQDEQGRIALVNDGPLDGAAWDVNSHKGDVAVLAELNLGLSYCLTRNISLIAGYRVMGVSGVALSAEQIPNDLRRVNDAYTINSDNGLLLHGGHAGIEFLY